jgi:hypothetical protein
MKLKRKMGLVVLSVLFIGMLTSLVSAQTTYCSSFEDAFNEWYGPHSFNGWLALLAPQNMFGIADTQVKVRTAAISQTRIPLVQVNSVPEHGTG